MNKKVLAFAMKAHEGQWRKFSNKTIPYIIHPIEVAFELNEFFLHNPIKGNDEDRDEETLINVALLHDVLEDCDVEYEHLYIEFGKKVADGVLELTNPTKKSTLPRAERKAIDREHLKNISANGKIIKLIDRACNLRDMEGATTDFKRVYLEESKQLYEEVFFEVRFINLIGMFWNAFHDLRRTLT